MKVLLECLKILAKNRINIFIGITAFLISIIIFIAQIISSKDVLEVEKKAYLKSIKIINLLKDSIILLLICWISSIFKYFNYIKLINILYIIIELLINISIIIISFKVIKQFKDIIYIYINIDKKKNILLKYINELINKYERELSKYTINYKNNRDFLLNKINNNRLKYQVTYDNTNKYEIKYNKSGYIENINYKKLNKIIKKLDDNESIIITKLPGDKIYINETIFITNNDKYANELLNIIKLDDNNTYNEIQLHNVFKQLIESESNNNIFDINNLLTEIYLDLINNKKDEIIAIFNNELYSEYNDKFIILNKLNDYDVHKLKLRILFLKRILSKIISNENNNNYSISIIDFINEICTIMLLRVNNSEDFIDYYVDDITNYLLVITKNNKLYETVLYNLLYIIVILLNNKLIKEYEILVNNLYIDDDLLLKYNYNIEFILGIIKLYIVLDTKDKEHNTSFVIDNKLVLKNNYDKLCNMFLDNQNIEISKFISTYKKSNRIRQCSNIMDFLVLKEKYSKHHFGVYISIGDLLNYIFANKYLSIYYDKNNALKYLSIDDNKILYNIKKFHLNSNLKDIITIEEYMILEINEYIDDMILIINNKYQNYINNLDITKEIEEYINYLINMLDINNLYNGIIPIENKNIVRHKEYTIKDNIPKESFKINLTKNAFKNYEKEFNKYIIDKINNVLINNSIKIEKSLDEVLKSIKDISNYIILTNITIYRKIGNIYKYKDINIPVYKILNNNYFNKDNIILINKKYLPIIKTYKLSNNNDYKKVDINIVNKGMVSIKMYLNIDITINKNNKLYSLKGR